MPTLVVLDRVEADRVILSPVEGPAPFDLPLSVLPAGAREGDIFSLTLTPCADETVRSREQLQARLDALVEGDPPGEDFSL